MCLKSLITQNFLSCVTFYDDAVILFEKFAKKVGRNVKNKYM